MAKRWTEQEVEFLKKNYPIYGKIYCAEKLNLKEHQIRHKASMLQIKCNANTLSVIHGKINAAKSAIGKKRPKQGLVMKQMWIDGKFKKRVPKEVKIAIMKNHWANNPHPRGFLGKKHSEDTKKQLAIKSKEMWNSYSEEKKEMILYKTQKTRRAKGISTALNRTNCSWKSAWREIGGKRKYYRSRWEYNYACYLEFLKNKKLIKEWLHESETFWFEGIKRGCMSYLPDFRITNIDDSIEYHEVKGWNDARSQTTIKRMAKYHPNIKLIVIYQKQYYEIMKKFKGIIKEFEID